MRLANYVGFLDKAEHNLAQAFRIVGEGHAEEADIFHTCNKLALKCDQHLSMLEEVAERYGREAPAEPDRLQLQAMDIARKGSLGLLRDLEDLYILVAACEQAWVAVGQAAQAARDSQLTDIVGQATTDCAQQRKWIQTRVKSMAAQALVVGELAQSMARKPPWRHGLLERAADRFGAVGQALHIVTSGTLSIIVVGILAHFTKQPLLFASLGPSAYLFFEEPMSDKSTPRNSIVGHVVGMAVGYACLVALGLSHQPDVLKAGVTIPRIFAAALSVGFTGAVLTLLRASHPPAGATTLLVSLGFFTSLKELACIAVGVLIVTGLALAINRFLGASVPLWGKPRDRTRLRIRKVPAPDPIPGGSGPRSSAA